METSDGIVLFLERFPTRLTVTVEGVHIMTNHPEQVLEFLLDNLPVENVGIVLKGREEKLAHFTKGE
jgi:hypothetical protein